MQLIKATMIDRILADNESALKANKVCTEFGLKPAKNRAQLRDNMRYLILNKNVSEQALLNLARVHPDRELILEAEKLQVNNKNMNLVDDTLNCSGCGAGKMYGNGDGGVASYKLKEDYEVKLRGGASQKFPKDSIIKGVISNGQLTVSPDVNIPESKLELVSGKLNISANNIKAFFDNYGKVILIASVVLVSGALIYKATKN
jgi:hypothetical protein